jgi:hypothetical protein
MVAGVTVKDYKPAASPTPLDKLSNYNNILILQKKICDLPSSSSIRLEGKSEERKKWLVANC